jgi:hypothetical protein
LQQRRAFEESKGFEDYGMEEVELRGDEGRGVAVAGPAGYVDAV